MSASNTCSPYKLEKSGSEAMNHLVQGKRHILVQDYSSAVYSLQESCQLFAKHYGETANECGEAYFCYGKALLELAREETGVFGNALPGDSGEEDAEASDSENAEENTEKSQDDDDDDDDDNEEESENESEKTGNPSPDSTSQTGDPTEPGTSSGAQKEEKEEDVSNLQLAWESLEVAKIIFKRQAETNDAMKLKMADVLLKLGEVSIESENYKQAVEDLLECFEIQSKLLQPDDRQIAETHYQLGLAYSFDNQFEDSINSFKNALSIIELRIMNLKQRVKDLGGSLEKPVSSLDCMMSMADADPVTIALLEIKELETIVPDMRTKMEDIEDLMRNTQEALIEATLQKMEEQNAFPHSSTGLTGSDFKSTEETKTMAAKPISNIGHLVKRKRKPEDSVDVSSSSEVKKSKPDQSDNNSQNGEVSVSTGTQNKEENTSGRVESEIVADTTQTVEC